MGQLSDGVPAIVNALGGCHKRGPAGAHGNATKTGIEVRCVDGEHGFILRHLVCLG